MPPFSCGCADLPVDELGEPQYAPEVSVGVGDAARMEVAWPASTGPAGDPYLVKWNKALPGPVTFEGLPCS